MGRTWRSASSDTVISESGSKSSPGLRQHGARVNQGTFKLFLQRRQQLLTQAGGPKQAGVSVGGSWVEG